ncbi:DNA-binding protein WhiA [Facklamia hominis]|uniref:DNA-binding protein WhiA n=1 Tax=Facklamia hominis TaxID=178214 RepID=UPI00101CA84E|nr:DNA-binding protein WhiA [Facklamia hominis]RYC98350.1 DNA-binding protein WhiA [Facklamia hominis]
MTFASDIKKECTLLEVHHEHAKAELAALIRMNGLLNIQRQRLILDVQSENAAIARRIYTLIKDQFSNEGELIVRRKMKLKKNNVYIVRFRQGVLDLLNELEIWDQGEIQTDVSSKLMLDEQKKRSYLRGAFLAGGSVNTPTANSYHLEIYSNYEDHSDSLCKMMNDFSLNAKITKRRRGYIVYIKEAEKIADFLAVIGATRGMLAFEDIRIVRDMRNSVNRLVNCENANLNKVIDASQKQVEAIKLIQSTKGLQVLPEKLRQIAEFRLENPDLSLKELGHQVSGGPISKSGVNHRLRKIIQIAEQIQNE